MTISKVMADSLVESWVSSMTPLTAALLFTFARSSVTGVSRRSMGTTMVAPSRIGLMDCRAKGW